MTGARNTPPISISASKQTENNPEMDEVNALRTFIRHVDRFPVVFTTGYLCRRAQAIRDSPNHFYMTGSMGLALAIAAGIAEGLPPSFPVFAVDGDGSWLMNPTNTVLIGMRGLSNVHHIVIDNGSYESTGGQPTASSYVDFVGAARALGFGNATAVNSYNELNERLEASVSSAATGSTFTHCRVEAVPGSPGGRLGLPLNEVRIRFQEWIRSCSEKLRIPCMFVTIRGYDAVPVAPRGAEDGCGLHEPRTHL